MQSLKCAAYVPTITAAHVLINDHTLLLGGTTSLRTVGSIFFVENTTRSFTALKRELTAVLNCFSNLVEILPLHGSLK